MGSTYQSIVVPAPASAVWQTLRDFHDLSWAPGVIESCEAVGDHAGTQPGAQRILNDAFHETLHAVNDVDRILKYSIDDGPSPVSKDEVSNYVGRIEVRPVTHDGTDAPGSATFVEWSSGWDAKTDEAEEFCQTIYVSLLRALREHFSGEATA